MKCSRAICNQDGIYEHRLDHRFYCGSCARLINEHNPGDCPLVPITEEPVNQPPIPPAPIVKVDSKPEIDKWQRRLQQAIFRITEKVPTADRQRVDRFIRFASAANARLGESEFPITLRRHVKDPERTSTFIAKADLLHFHVANTISAFYDLVRADGKVPAVLEDRAALLERIGREGFTDFVIVGNDGEGYRLYKRGEEPVKFLKPGGVNDDGHTGVA